MYCKRKITGKEEKSKRKVVLNQEVVVVIIKTNVAPTLPS
jgi:hypothetical protein